MYDFSVLQLAIITTVFLLAGMVKGITGMGLPTVAMGLLGVFMPPVTAASLLIIPSFITNVWQLFTGPDFSAILRRLYIMMLGIIVGTIIGSALLTNIHYAGLTAGFLGITLAAYACFGLFGRPLSVPPHSERWLSPVIGIITGLITGATGVFVIPAVPYIQALGFEKEELIQALGLSFTVSTIALAIGLGHNNAFHAHNMIISAIAVIPALLGMTLGQIIRLRISPAIFRRWFLICLVLLGVELFVSHMISLL